MTSSSVCREIKSSNSRISGFLFCDSQESIEFHATSPCFSWYCSAGNVQQYQFQQEQRFRQTLYPTFEKCYISRSRVETGSSYPTEGTCLPPIKHGNAMCTSFDVKLEPNSSSWNNVQSVEGCIAKCNSIGTICQSEQVDKVMKIWKQD